MSGGGQGQSRPEARGAYVVIGVVLIVVGLGLLAGVPLFGWSWGALSNVMREVRQVGWPLAVVLLGVAIIVYSRRPGARLPSKEARLTRSRDKKMIAGVFGGLSDYFGVDVTVLRIAFLAVAFLFDLWGPFIVGYIAAAVIVPMAAERLVPTPDEPVWPEKG